MAEPTDDDLADLNAELAALGDEFVAGWGELIDDEEGDEDRKAVTT